MKDAHNIEGAIKLNKNPKPEHLKMLKQRAETAKEGEIIYIDLQNVERMSAETAYELLSIQQELLKHKATFSLVNIPNTIHKGLKASKFDQFFDFYHDHY